MARAHEQMVRDLFERWNSGIVELPREDAHTKLEIVSRLSNVRGRPFKGYAEAESWIRDMHDSFDEWTLHAQ